MAKRRSETGQMRREEYEAADDDVSADSFEIGFQRASEESIRKRKIVKARVSSRPPKPTTPAAAGDNGAKSNPFGGFQGLTATKPAAASNPFAGFSGLTGTAKPAEKATVASTGSNAATSRSYQQAIEGLNKYFLAFVNGQSQKNPSASWEAAVQDYLSYAGEIANTHASTKPVAINESKRAAPFSFGSAPAATAASLPTPAPSSSSFSFGGSVAKKTEESAKSPASGFSFGGTAKKSEEPAKTSTTGGFSFSASAKKDHAAKSPAKASGGFSFGVSGSSLFSSKPSDSEAKTTPAFSFGALPKPSTSSTSATGGFSFGSATAPKSTTPATAAAGDEDEENIGREEATVIIKADSPDDDCTFEADKAKVFEFKKDEKRWADKGVHPLKVLVSKETKTARILVRNQIGKIVLNSALYKGMAVHPHEAKGKKTGVTLSLQVEGGEMTQFLLKVNASRVDEFIKALETAASSS
ncbi:hypothetical protein V7S43_016730 [Phytophthora oleae]|uniref:RanBD1 domain-containing protein n=1 Tax=Phytophthora oleae TaxID=2107226 RepID=A0ABD3EV03_9STRA